jgi:NAD(P)-dependent dehydrogenase (short-subunit alcohol dehydrogenase family)
MKNSGLILLTGADGGLGVPVLARLLEDGFQVTAVIHNPDKISGLRERFPTPALRVLAADLTTEEGAASIFEGIEALRGVVHLAGGFQGTKTLTETSLETFERMIGLNTRATFLVIRSAMSLMKRLGSGAIVTVGARPALHPGQENAVYAASKAAVINLTLTAAEEGRSHHITANVLVPNVIRTAGNLAWASSPAEADKWTPPEDIASVISYLVSDQGAPVTGTVIPLYHGLKG